MNDEIKNALVLLAAMRGELMFFHAFARAVTRSLPPAASADFHAEFAQSIELARSQMTYSTLDDVALERFEHFAQSWPVPPNSPNQGR